MTTINIEKALESVASPHTRRMYERALGRLAQWLDGRELSYSIVREYKAEMVQAGYSPQNINAHLSAIRFYVREQAKAGQIAIEQSESVCQVEGVKVKGRKLGNWLSIQEAEKLLNAPDVETPLGLRDRAILALLVGAGLRRSEVVGLQVKHFERRTVADEDGHSAKRWMLIGVTGKHGRTRNIPVADWVKALVDQWTARASIAVGYLFRSVSWSEKRFWLKDEPLDAATLFYIVKRHGWQAERGQIAPHDLRRTFARLAYEGNAPLAQIQLALGHANQSTTENYVNAAQDLRMSPSDVLGLNPST
ncbi:MAG: tyrosine-type recombinase/integrase [Blastocatellia bacterium]